MKIDRPALAALLLLCAGQIFYLRETLIGLQNSIEAMPIQPQQEEIEKQCLKTVYSSSVCGAEIETVTCRMPGESFAELKARHQQRVAEAKAECPEGQGD